MSPNHGSRLMRDDPAAGVVVDRVAIDAEEDRGFVGSHDVARRLDGLRRGERRGRVDDEVAEREDERLERLERLALEEVARAVRDDQFGITRVAIGYELARRGHEPNLSSSRGSSSRIQSASSWPLHSSARS